MATTSFIILLLLAAGLAAAALFSAKQSPVPIAATAMPANNAPSGRQWQEYADQTYNLKFKYPTGWQVTATANDPTAQAYVINLQPNDGSYPLKIFVSLNGYIGLKNLKTEAVIVGGQNAVEVDDTLAALKQGVNYFTFDLGRNTALAPQFKTLLASVQFVQ